MDLDLLKTFCLIEKTQEDIDTIMSMTQGLPFVINYNNTDIHRLICTNMRVHDYKPDSIIYDSSSMDNIDFLIYSGSVNVYTVKKVDNKDSLTLIREVAVGDCFGSFELNIMKKNMTKIEKVIAISNEKTKVIIFENKARELVEGGVQPIKTKRELMITQRENNGVYFDPEIFLFDNPQKIYDIIDGVKVKLADVFKGVNKHEDLLNELKKEKEFKEILDAFPVKRELKEIFNFIDSKYGKDYSDNAILDLKLGMITLKSIESVPKMQTDIEAALDELKNKFYDKNNAKNRNLIQLNIDKEFETDDFQDYIYEQINNEKNLDELMQKKKKNETKIEQNKKLIKKEENLLLNSYYCIYCHVRPRDAISTNCHHLMICEECMKKTKICPKCGVNIENYHKIYRS